jgi:hypothetical protein
MNGFRNGTRALGMVLLVAATSAQAQERGPLSLAKASYFFVGGKIDTAAEGSPMVGQMYVEKNNAAIAGVIAQWLDRQRLREKQAGR